MPKINKKTLIEVTKAIMATAQLEPDFEDNYFGNANATTISAFCEGACIYFKKPRDYWMFHFCNIGYLDSPVETLDFFISHIDQLIQENQ